MNWITLGADDLRAVAAGDFVDGAPTAFVAEAIAGTVALVRGAVAAGNALDANPATVPGSLRTLAARLAVYGLVERLGGGLTPEQRAARSADDAWLRTLREEAQRVEPADRPGGVQTVAPGNSGHGREELRGI